MSGGSGRQQIFDEGGVAAVDNHWLCSVFSFLNLGSEMLRLTVQMKGSFGFEASTAL